MKLVILIPTIFHSFLFTSNAKIIDLKIRNSSLATAVNRVVDIMSEQYDITVINLISPSDDFHLKDFHHEIVAKYRKISNIHFRIETSNSKLTNIRGRKKRFSIISIKIFHEFLTVYKMINREKFWINGLYLIVLINGSISEINEMSKLLWTLQIYNVNFMFLKEDDSVKVATFFPFKPGSCNKTTTIIINEFKNGSFIDNGVLNFFPIKMSNLHNCSIRISTGNNAQPFIIASLQSNNEYKMSGRDIELLEALAQSLNFRINYTFIGPAGYLHENGSASGPLKALLDKQADLSINDWWLKAFRLKFFDATTFYITESIKFIIPRGSQLTTFQKLIMPFDPSVWVLIFVCFIVGFLIIRVISCQTKQIQSFVFGSRVQSPYLNMFIAFIGGYQKILPKRNFARFLLMIFLMYSLVIRTLYQGSYYKFLQSGRQNDVVASVDEMIERDFTFYGTHPSKDVFRATSAMQNRLKYFSMFKFFIYLKFFSPDLQL